MEKNIKILLIEDEVLNAMSLILDLKKQGYNNARYVTSGEQAFKMVNKEMPDLLISDISLSGGESGIDVAEEIVGKSGIPVIFTTGYEMEDLAEKMKEFKDSHFIRKPIIISKLVKLIEKL